MPSPLKSLTLGANIFGHKQCHMPGSIEITTIFSRTITYKSICSTASVLQTKLYSMHLCKIMSKFFLLPCSIQATPWKFPRTVFSKNISRVSGWAGDLIYEAWNEETTNESKKCINSFSRHWKSYSLTMQSKNFCPVFLVCPLLKHRKVSVSYALADLPPTAKTPHFSFL